MSVRRPSPKGSRVLALLALVATLLLAACGGGSSSSDGSGAATAGPDPASLSPRDAAVYAEVLARPSGTVEQGVLAAARKVLQVQDPAAELQRLLDQNLEESGTGQTYAKTIEPWLGERIGLFLLMPRGGGGDPDVAVVVAARDRAALMQEYERQRSAGELRGGGTYRGVRYMFEKDDRSPNAIVDDFLVVGTSMRALRAAVDASKGANLADSERYRAARDPLAEDRLAFAYADPARVLANVDASTLPDPRLADLLASQRDADPVTLELTARANEIALELHADVGGTPLAGLEDGGLSVGEMPGDAWLAFATPALGPLVRSILDAAGARGAAAAQIRAVLGLDLDRDLLDPLGGVAGFTRGTGVLDLGGGLLLDFDDSAAAEKLVTRAETIANAAGNGLVRSLGNGFELRIPRSPQPIVVQREEDRVAVGYAAASARDLLNPQERFDDSPAGKAAIASLGEGFTPSLVVRVPPIAQLLESLDAIGIADLSDALPYVRPYRSVAMGTKRDDDRITVRVVAALR